jgi:GT2 family glycosyltransferase
MKEPLVSILIVNWNGSEILPECLGSLKKQLYRNIEVIVVDNASSDNSLDILKQFAWVRVIKSKKNLGFAGGNNLGFTYTKGKYIFLFNSDATAPIDLLQKLVSSLEKDSSVAAVQPKFLYEDNTINSLGAYLTNTGFLYYPGYGKKDTRAMYKKSSFIFSGYGAGLLIHRDVIEKIGLFDDDYFMYFEESDFSMRIWLSGWKILYNAETTIIHKGGVSSKKYGLEKIYFHSYKNRICTYIKNFELPSLITIVPLHVLLCYFISLLYLFTGKFAFFWAVQKAILWNISSLPKTLHKRSIIQKDFRKISDKKYFRLVLRSPRPIYYLYLFRGLQYYID